MRQSHGRRTVFSMSSSNTARRRGAAPPRIAHIAPRCAPEMFQGRRRASRRKPRERTLRPDHRGVGYNVRAHERGRRIEARILPVAASSAAGGVGAAVKYMSFSHECMTNNRFNWGRPRSIVFVSRSLWISPCGGRICRLELPRCAPSHLCAPSARRPSWSRCVLKPRLLHPRIRRQRKRANRRPAFGRRLFRRRQ